MKARLYTLLAILLTASMILAACVTQPTETPPAKPSPPSAPMEEPLAAIEPSTDVSDMLENTSGEPESIADDATPSDETGQESNLTLWHGMGELEILALHDIVAAFQTRYPSLRINVLYLPFDDLYARYAAAAAAGDGPDLLLGPGEWGPALYDAGLIADVTSLASPELLSNINRAALDVVQYRGDLIGLPHSISGVVMYRNSSIVADAPADFDALVASA
ncbi:MAG: extracellular solute-binding protein, partial [Chloroflexota bacterium]